MQSHRLYIGFLPSVLVPLLVAHLVTTKLVVRGLFQVIFYFPPI
ncbi:hypothetical protein RintRC_1401 [Richelia intracellularis]|nr:hypothetical protein RintRC_1401 [Richelia intracellularis]